MNFIRRKRCCPGCGAVMSTRSNFCSKCCSFVETGYYALRDARWVTDQDLQKLLDDSTKQNYKNDSSIRNTFGDWGCKLGFLFMVPLFLDDFFPDDSLFPLAAALAGDVILFLTCCFIYPRIPLGVLEKAPENLRILGRKYIAFGEVTKLLGDYASYLPEGEIAETVIRDADGFVHGFYDYKGCELVQADYRNISIEMEHIQLTTDTGKGQHGVIIFEGHCLVARTDLVIPEKIQITKKSGTVKVPVDDTQPLEFKDFFNTECQNQEVVSQILTPQRKARILEIYKNSPGAVSLLLKSDGMLLIACEDDESKVFLGSMSTDFWRPAYSKILTTPLRVLDVFLDCG